MAEKLIIATIVYGDYIGMFDEICLRSLFQRGNIPWLLKNGYDVEYIIYTKEGDNKARLQEVVDSHKWKGLDVTINDFYGVNNARLLEELIRKGIDENARVLFLNPDYFFANDCLKHLVSYKYSGNICVAALHVRVNSDSFQEEIKKVKGAISSPKLVSMAMRCLHKSWGESFIDSDSNNSFVSGSMVQPVDENMWAITFRLPTVFMAKFDESDIEALRQFDFWDHEWPSHLMSQQRYKFVGSSDFFFAVELTSPNSNIPPVSDGRLWNDEFHVNKPHNDVNRKFLVIVRGE